MGKSNSAQPVFLLVLAAVATLLMALIIAPFAGALFAGAVFAVVTFPLQKWLSRRLGNRRGLAAGVLTSAGIVLAVLPLVWVSWSASEQITDLYRSAESTYSRGGLEGLVQHVPAPLRPAALRVGAALALDKAGKGESKDEPKDEPKDEATGETANPTNKPGAGGALLDSSRLGTVAKVASGVAAFLASLAIDLGITVLAFFFLLAQGDRLVAWVLDTVPLSRAKTQSLLDQFEKVTRGVFFATVAAAAIQTVLASIGYAIAGVDYLAGAIVLTFVAALIPIIGGAVVVIALGVWLLASGETGYGIFLIVWGAVVVGLSDNLVKPWLAKDALRLPGSIVLFAMLGGIAVFGPMGIVAGPLIVAFFLAALRLLAQEHVE